jgi:hypothetical protein
LVQFLALSLCRERALEMEHEIKRQRQLDIEHAKTRQLQFNLDMEKEKQTQVQCIFICSNWNNLYIFEQMVVNNPPCMIPLEQLR